MSAFAEIGYREDGPEEVDHVPGSVTTDAYRGRLSCRPSSVAHIRASATGEAALERIKGILNGGKARNGRGQSTTPARLVSTDAFQAARRALIGGA